MTAPAVTGLSFDKTVYNTGDTITLTVAYTPGTSLPAPVTDTVTVVGTDQPSGAASSPATQTFEVQAGASAADTTTWTVTDSGNRTWTQVSDNGAEAVFTAVA